jgi:transposase-like protein
VRKSYDMIHRFEHGLMNYRAFPPELRKKIRTTNLLERFHKEIKRRSKKIGAFPNEILSSILLSRSLSTLMRSGSPVNGIYL